MTTSRPLILLPPSEGKASGGAGPAWAPGSMAIDLDPARTVVATALLAAMRQNETARAALLGVKGHALRAATDANRRIRTSATTPAIERYSGVLYEALDAASLSPAARRRLDASVLIASGLWGLVAPTDLIPEYKLKMGASLGRLGRLSTWWRAELTSALQTRARGRLVWDLLPNEHAAAWRPGPGLRRVVVTFLDRLPDGSLVSVSHRSKHLKGVLARFLVEHPGATPADLGDWSHPSGYRLDPARSEERDGLQTLVMSRSA